jgi:hypothetical protein
VGSYVPYHGLITMNILYPKNFKYRVVRENIPYSNVKSIAVVDGMLISLDNYIVRGSEKIFPILGTYNPELGGFFDSVGSVLSSIGSGVATAGTAVWGATKDVASGTWSVTKTVGTGVFDVAKYLGTGTATVFKAVTSKEGSEALGTVLTAGATLYTALNNKNAVTPQSLPTNAYTQSAQAIGNDSQGRTVYNTIPTGADPSQYEAVKMPDGSIGYAMKTGTNLTSYLIYGGIGLGALLLLKVTKVI